MANELNRPPQISPEVWESHFKSQIDAKIGGHENRAANLTTEAVIADLGRQGRLATPTASDILLMAEKSQMAARAQANPYPLGHGQRRGVL